jgi:putative membrane protein
MGPFGFFDGGFGIGFLLIFAIYIAFWVAVVALIILAIRWLIRNTNGGSSRRPGDDSAMELLRQRFARGEIDAAEFEERKRSLGG